MVRMEKPWLELSLLLSALVTATQALVASEMRVASERHLRPPSDGSCQKQRHLFHTEFPNFDQRCSRNDLDFDLKLVRRRDAEIREDGVERAGRIAERKFQERDDELQLERGRRTSRLESDETLRSRRLEKLETRRIIRGTLEDLDGRDVSVQRRIAERRRESVRQRKRDNPDRYNRIWSAEKRKEYQRAVRENEQGSRQSERKNFDDGSKNSRSRTRSEEVIPSETRRTSLSRRSNPRPVISNRINRDVAISRGSSKTRDNINIEREFEDESFVRNSQVRGEHLELKREYFVRNTRADHIRRVSQLETRKRESYSTNSRNEDSRRSVEEHRSRRSTYASKGEKSDEPLNRESTQSGIREMRIQNLQRTRDEVRDSSRRSSIRQTVEIRRSLRGQSDDQESVDRRREEVQMSSRNSGQNERRSERSLSQRTEPARQLSRDAESRSLRTLSEDRKETRDFHSDRQQVEGRNSLNINTRQRREFEGNGRTNLGYSESREEAQRKVDTRRNCDGRQEQRQDLRQRFENDIESRLGQDENNKKNNEDGHSLKVRADLESGRIQERSSRSESDSIRSRGDIIRRVSNRVRNPRVEDRQRIVRKSNTARSLDRVRIEERQRLSRESNPARNLESDRVRVEDRQRISRESNAERVLESDRIRVEERQLISREMEEARNLGSDRDLVENTQRISRESDAAKNLDRVRIEDRQRISQEGDSARDTEGQQQDRTMVSDIQSKKKQEMLHADVNRVRLGVRQITKRRYSPNERNVRERSNNNREDRFETNQRENYYPRRCDDQTLIHGSSLTYTFKVRRESEESQHLESPLIDRSSDSRRIMDTTRVSRVVSSAQSSEDIVKDVDDNEAAVLVKILHLIKDVIILSCLVLPLTNYIDSKRTNDVKQRNYFEKPNYEIWKSDILKPANWSTALLKRFWTTEQTAVH